MSRSLSISAGCDSWTGDPFLSSMTLTPEGLSALTEHQGNHFAAGVTLERNLSTYWLGDKDVLAVRRGLLRRLAGTWTMSLRSEAYTRRPSICENE